MDCWWGQFKPKQDVRRKALVETQSPTLSLREKGRGTDDRESALWTQKMDLVAFADFGHIGEVAGAVNFAIDIAEERFGVSGDIKDEHARGVVRISLEAMNGSGGRIDEFSGTYHLFLTGDGEAYASVDDIVGFVPRMIVRWRARQLRQIHLHERPGLVGLVGGAQKSHMGAQHVERIALALLHYDYLLTHNYLLVICIDIVSHTMT